MKNIAIVVMLALGFTATAQVNQNVTKESTTTTVTVNNGTKPRKITKTETTEAKQNIELKDADSKKLNKDVKPTPVQVSSSTTIQGDGIPTYYELNGERYIFVTDRNGYKIASPTVKNYGVVRKTDNGQYIYRTSQGTSIGHFDDSGNFVVETYDDKSDGITVETYTKVANP
ncbi:hypothetical protein [Flavobacterium psychrotrophum]|uniref:hypothetical protein n=1 Tax=Flavobacterium psychrotrophum TaxID=2294119 RepID=UPI000E31BC39|nr:hypothetical protein [Flavobacterium psychrotrophum]